MQEIIFFIFLVLYTRRTIDNIQKQKKKKICESNFRSIPSWLWQRRKTQIGLPTYHIKSINHPKELKFCICFFGVLSRSLDYTIKSINENIFNVLSDNNIKADLFVHDMLVTHFKSTRANDNAIIKNKSELLNSLNCNRLFYDSTIQTTFDNNFDWDKTNKYGYMENNLNTHKNAIRQLYSVKKVTQMWEKKNNSYDLYIYLRPDLLYINTLNLKRIIDTLLFTDYLGTPRWHKWGGINDRIYMGNKNIINKFGNRLDFVEDYINKKKKYYHPEKFMKYILSENNIKSIPIDLKGKRVRANGYIVNENFNK